MKVSQYLWRPSTGWSPDLPGSGGQPLAHTLVMAFGNVDAVHDPLRFGELQEAFPGADIVMGSTAGEIAGQQVYDDAIVVTVSTFQKTPLKAISLDVADFANSFDCGAALFGALYSDALRHVFLLSDGTGVNGDELVRGINDGMPGHVLVTGGLAADAGRFARTYVGLNQPPLPGRIVAIGYYGDAVVVGHGSMGGWNEFGPIRVITRSRGNVLYELDGMNALDLYKKYLGDRAADLPGAALLFPLSLFTGDDGQRVVRTILSIDEAGGSMTFAGDVPMGARVQFMMANLDRLIDGAGSAAEHAAARESLASPELVVMISCVGRKIVLQQRTEEEVEAVTDFFGDTPVYTGFYSNGEISPVLETVGCSLHNQTMTITTYAEA